MNEGLRMQKTVKVGEIQTGKGFDLIVILDRVDLEKGKPPVQVFKKWYEFHGDGHYGWHKKKVGSFVHLLAAMQYMTLVVAGRIDI